MGNRLMKSFRNLLAVLAITVIATHPLFAQHTPEIDPGMGIGALALIGGIILVMRGRVKL
jgi:hypothetical protein